MPTAKLTRALAREAVNAVDAALREGFYPKGAAPPSGQKGAIARGADFVGVNRKTFSSRIRAAEEYFGLVPDWSLYTQPDPIVVKVKPPKRHKIRVYTGETDEPDEPEYRVLAIGDLHDSPALPEKDRFRWIGRYANEHAIPHIFQIGDFATFDSCSSFEDYGTISGRMKPSFENDIDSLEEAIGAMVTQFDEGYDPDRFVIMGNHENRVYQWEDEHPEVEGMFGLRLEQAFSRGRFDYCQYGEWKFLGGVGFTHVPFTIMGKPYGGKMPQNMIGNDAIFSIVFGHTHKGFVMPRPKIGPQRRITICNLGCALNYTVEDYARMSMTGWTYGIYDLTLRANDIQSHRFIPMRELEKKYG